MSYKKYNYSILATDYNSSYIRHYCFTLGFMKYKKLLNISSPIIGVVSEKNDIDYIGDLSTWTKSHEDLKKQVNKDYRLVDKIIDKMEKYGKEFNKWSEKEIFNKDLTKLSAKKLISLVKQFAERQSDLYALGTSLPTLDFQNFSFIEGHLKNFLQSKLKRNEFKKVYQVFTEPIRNSYAQDQEEDLLKLMSEFYKNKKWLNDIKKKNLEDLKSLHPGFYKKLKNHTKKYAWVYYVYEGPAYSEVNYLNFIKDYIERKINPDALLKKLEYKKKNIEKLKKDYLKRLKPDKFNLSILNLAGKFIWAKPRRKDRQSKSYYHLEKLYKEIAKRLFISLNQARSTPIDELEEALIEGKINENLLNSIYNFHVTLPNPNNDGTVTLLYGKDAHEFNDKFVKREKIKKTKDIKKLKGQTAYTGITKGKVKIINKPTDMKKMKYNDILVSTATTPSIVPAMKKAAAIITDEGGLTCHAAIVSRELTIPCIVGLKVATQVLKDGDLVKVDAEKGIVKILKK